METPHLSIETANKVRTITMNRPDKRNPLGLPTYRQFHAAIDAAEDDDDVRAIVITGAGVAFSAGGELGGGHPVATTYDWYRIHTEMVGHLNRIRDCMKPVIASVNGICYGSGVILAAHCDMVIAADSATFGFVEGRMGLAGIGMLPFHIGGQWAKFLITTGEVITAERAKSIGLALEVVPAADLAARVQALGERIAAMPPYGVELNKRSVNATLDAMGWPQAAGVNRSHYPVIDMMAPHAVNAEGRLLPQVMKEEGWKAWLEARDAAFRQPWLED